MTSPLPVVLLLTLLTIYSAECAVLQSSVSSDSRTPVEDDSAPIKKLSGPSSINRISDGHVDGDTRHRADFLRRMLQLSSGLEARHRPETQVEELMRERSSGVVGTDDESEGSIASLRLLAKILSDLTDLEDNTGSDLHEIPQKRTCRFNLGGHCATEEAVNMANQWHFFNSPFSPGRRRRNALTAAAESDASASIN